MREWYRISFTPNHAVNPSKEFDCVTDLIIDGEFLKNRDNRIGKESISNFSTDIIKEARKRFKTNYFTIDNLIELIDELQEKD